MSESKNYQNVSVTDQENAEVKIEGEITAEKMADARTRALEKIREEAEVDGFRKGSAPDDVLINQYGEMTVLQNAAEMALNEEYPTILQDHQVTAIGQPQVQITKLAPGEPLGFSIQTATMPQIELADYKKVAAEELAKEDNQISEPEVSDKEVDDVMLQLRRNMAAQQQQSSEDGASQQDPSEMSDDALPELDDAFVQMMGFESVQQLKDQIKDNIKQEKQNKEKEKQQLAVLDAIIEQSDITLPEVVITNELEKMMQQLKHDVQQAGYEYDQYLQQSGKTDEGLRQEWRPQAIKKAKTQLILNRIATEEDIKPDQDQVNQQLEQIMQQYENADREQAKVFVETQLMNQQVVQFLESFGPEGSTQQTESDGSEEDASAKDEKKETKKKASSSAKKSSSTKSTSTKSGSSKTKKQTSDSKSKKKS